MSDTNYSLKEGVDEFSLNELKTKLNKYVQIWKRNWKIIVLVTSLGAISGFVYAYFQKYTYTANITFAFEEEKSMGGISGALGLANSLGLDLAGNTSAGGAFSGVNLIGLMKSRTLIERALLNPITDNGKTLSMAQYFINFSNLNKNWSEQKSLQNIRFEPYANRSEFNLQQDSIFGILYNRIAGKNGILSVFQKDKKVGILTIEVISENELFAKFFAEAIAKEVSDFYVSTKSKKAKLNYEILQKQTDSIRAELNSAIVGVAQANDNTFNLNTALDVRRVPSAKRQIDVQANTAILLQLITNLEMAKVSLRKETPLIQIIDKPILPLDKTKLGKIKASIIGGFIAFMIILVFIVFYRGFLNANLKS